MLHARERFVERSLSVFLRAKPATCFCCRLPDASTPRSRRYDQVPPVLRGLRTLPFIAREHYPQSVDNPWTFRGHSPFVVSTRAERNSLTRDYMEPGARIELATS